MSTFGERLKQLRIERCLTLDNLKDILETTKATLSRYENNKNKPNIDFATKVAGFFDVDTDFILGESDIRRAKFINPKDKAYEKKLIEELNDYDRAVKIVATEIGMSKDVLEEQLSILRKMTEKKN